MSSIFACLYFAVNEKIDEKNEKDQNLFISICLACDVCWNNKL